MSAWTRLRLCAFCAHRYAQDRGHFFEVDEEKLERLKLLTRELRFGKSEDDNDSSDDDDDNDDNDDVKGREPENAMKVWHEEIGYGEGDTPVTSARSNTSGWDGDRSELDESLDQARAKVGQAWFEA